VVTLLCPSHTLKLSLPVEFGHSQARVEYSDIPFGPLRKHGEYSTDISAGQELKGAEGLG